MRYSYALFLYDIASPIHTPYSYPIFLPHIPTPYRSVMLMLLSARSSDASISTQF